MYAKISDLGRENMDILELLEDAKLFFKEVEECGFSLEQKSISFSKGLKNFQRLASYINHLSFPVDQIQFNSFSKLKNFEITKEIIHQLYDGLYDNEVDYLFSIMKLDSSLESFDGAIVRCYDIKTGTKNYDKGIIYSFKESYVPVILSHEFTHAFYGKNFSSGRNYNYNEFCSIFADFFAANYIDSISQENVLNKYSFIRFSHLKDCFKDFNVLYEHKSEFMKPND